MNTIKFDPENEVVRLCAKGIETEYSGNIEAADHLYRQSWDLARSPLEKFTAAHYLARTQNSVEGQLRWNLLALEIAEAAREPGMESCFPSLYLNAGKSCEDSGDREAAKRYYLKARAFVKNLPDDGYGTMLLKGIEAALKRLKNV